MIKVNIGHGIRKTRCCFGRSRPIWKPFSLASKNAAARSPILSNARCGRICLVVCWPAGRSSHTKYYLQNLPERVEVTRPHHPLFGRELEVIHANKVMLTIRLANGSTMKMPRAWTNAGGATGVVEPLRCSVFTIEGVRELIDLVSALRRRD